MTEHNETFRLNEEQERLCYVYVQNRPTLLQEMIGFVCKVIVFYFLMQLLPALEITTILSALGN